jgi:hypothetical protein
MRALLIASLAFGVVAGAAAAKHAPRLGELRRAELDAFLSDLQKSETPFLERVAQVSARLRGTRYVRDPLGEGPRGTVDRDPIIDLRRVDCLTFVEEVLALSQRPSLEAATALLQQYRYEGGQIRYDQRRHFMELQWLPGLTNAGLIRDVTREIAGDSARLFERTVEEKSYRGAFRRWKKRLGDAAPTGNIRLSYVTAKDMVRLASRVPSGSILVLLRRTPEGAPTTVSHVGLVVRSGENLVFRHAIHVPGWVIDEKLTAYFAKHAHNPMTVGFHFEQPVAARNTDTVR